jgi:spore maturation protein CgeB
MKVLYISNSSEKRNVIDYMLDAFKHNDSISRFKVIYSQSDTLSKKQSLIVRFTHKILMPYSYSKVNEEIIKKIEGEFFDMIFISKGLYIWPSTLKKVKVINKKIKIVYFSNDNLNKWHNKSFFLHFYLKYCDYVYSIDIPSYKKIDKLTSAIIIYLDKCYSKRHHIYNKDNNILYDVIFIGSYENLRFEIISFLAQNGIQINVFGNGWSEISSIHDNLTIHNMPLIGDDYANAISQSKITLGFLRKKNEDTQTSRSIEIPACGGFMLMERTEKHKQLFEEGDDAEFFDTKDELLIKIQYYLSDMNAIDNIKLNGLKNVKNKCLDYDNRVARILSEVIGC